jgi:transcriptional regulator with XRE-family HTH domain
MRKTIEFLDAVKARHQLTSDYQLAKLLGVKQQTISSYRIGRSRLDEEMALRVAAELDLEPAHVLACIAAERTKSERVRKAWQRAAAATAAALALVAVAAHLALTGSDGAPALALVGAVEATSGYYVKCLAAILTAILAAALLSPARQPHE